MRRAEWLPHDPMRPMRRLPLPRERGGSGGAVPPARSTLRAQRRRTTRSSAADPSGRSGQPPVGTESRHDAEERARGPLQQARRAGRHRRCALSESAPLQRGGAACSTEARPDQDTGVRRTAPRAGGAGMMRRPTRSGGRRTVRAVAGSSSSCCRASSPWPVGSRWDSPPWTTGSARPRSRHDTDTW